MALRVPPYTYEQEREANAQIERLLWRSYIFLGLGLLARLLKIKIEKASVSGIEISLSSDASISGLFFLFSLMLSLLAFASGFLAALHEHRLSSRARRLQLFKYLVLSRKLKHASSREKIVWAKKKAKTSLAAVAVIEWILLLSPVLYIVLLERYSIRDTIMALTN